MYETRAFGGEAPGRSPKLLETSPGDGKMSDLPVYGIEWDDIAANS
jgi:hypothetical protein